MGVDDGVHHRRLQGNVIIMEPREYRHPGSDTARGDVVHAPDINPQSLVDVEMKPYIGRHRIEQPRRVVDPILKIGRLGAAHQEIVADAGLQGDEIQRPAADADAGEIVPEHHRQLDVMKPDAHGIHPKSHLVGAGMGAIKGIFQLDLPRPVPLSGNTPKEPRRAPKLMKTTVAVALNLRGDHPSRETAIERLRAAFEFSNSQYNYC